MSDRPEVVPLVCDKAPALARSREMRMASNRSRILGWSAPTWNNSRIPGWPQSIACKTGIYCVSEKKTLLFLGSIQRFQITFWMSPRRHTCRSCLLTSLPANRIIELMIHYYNTRSTQKKPGSTAECMFDTKKPGPTQKCPVRHKNTLPGMYQLTLPLYTRRIHWKFWGLVFLLIAAFNG